MWKKLRVLLAWDDQSQSVFVDALLYLSLLLFDVSFLCSKSSSRWSSSLPIQLEMMGTCMVSACLPTCSVIFHYSCSMSKFFSQYQVSNITQVFNPIGDDGNLQGQCTPYIHYWPCSTLQPSLSRYTGYLCIPLVCKPIEFCVVKSPLQKPPVSCLIEEPPIWVSLL